MDRFLSPAVVLAAAPIVLFLFARLLEEGFQFCVAGYHTVIAERQSTSY